MIYAIKITDQANNDIRNIYEYIAYELQLPDPLTVPSTRRYPVLADIFNRLGYMERKSSGIDD